MCINGYAGLPRRLELFWFRLAPLLLFFEKGGVEEDE